ncbi:MAG: SRPBCC family protein [Acidimicrobiia bacterium]
MARFADLPTVETSVVVNAPPERIWPLITDVNFPSCFSDEFQGGEWLDAGPALGARFVGRNSNAFIGEWETISTVDVFDPKRSFGYLVGDPASPGARWRYDIEPLAEGGMRVAMRAEMGPGRSGVTLLIHHNPEMEEQIVSARLGEWRKNMEAVLAGIKASAEGGSC